ncbi:hypothetical protein BH09MYX1_BH09MYX1_61400 [soil metagenome]
MKHSKAILVLSLGVAASAGAIFACSSDPVQTQPVVDSGADVTVDAKADVGATDGGSDAAQEAAPPCAEAGATITVGSGSGVQCDGDGGQQFCQKSSAVCCDNAGTLKCNSKVAGCGTAITFECDKNDDCNDGGVCCLKNFKAAQGCSSTLTSTSGTYCASACTGSDIRVCNGVTAACFNGTCTTLKLDDAPGKILSGCL